MESVKTACRKATLYSFGVQGTITNCIDLITYRINCVSSRSICTTSRHVTKYSLPECSNGASNGASNHLQQNLAYDSLSSFPFVYHLMSTVRPNLLARAAACAKSSLTPYGPNVTSNKRFSCDASDTTLLPRDIAASEADDGSKPRLSHVTETGAAEMVDVGDKSTTSRTAVASGIVHLGEAAFELVRQNKIAKGDVLSVAKLAGITGAKRTSDLVPLCHNVPISKVDVRLALVAESHSVHVSAEVRAVWKTGVEMEALTAVSVAALTLYDMCKAVSQDIVIGPIRLEMKTGGRRGDYKHIETAV